MADIIKYLRIPFPRFPLVKDASDDWNPVRGDYNGGVFAGPFGTFESVWQESVIQAAPAGGGNTIAESTIVPSGYLYVLQSVSLQHNDPSARRLQIQFRPGNYSILAWTDGAISWQPAIAIGCWVMEEGDYLQGLVYDLAEGRNAYLRLWGYKVKL
ncbi:MAG: hypothetical protein ACTSPX_01260 [Candidatus Thorarchaeota archaeon]